VVLPAKGRTYYELCMPFPDQSDKVPHEVVPESFEALCPGYPADAPPLFFGTIGCLSSRRQNHCTERGVP